MNRPLDLARLPSEGDTRSRVERLADGAVVVLEAAGIILAICALASFAAIGVLLAIGG